jgi:hypothetical protein
MQDLADAFPRWPTTTLGMATLPQYIAKFEYKLMLYKEYDYLWYKFVPELLTDPGIKEMAYQTLVNNHLSWPMCKNWLLRVVVRPDDQSKLNREWLALKQGPRESVQEFNAKVINLLPAVGYDGTATPLALNRNLIEQYFQKLRLKISEQMGRSHPTDLMGNISIEEVLTHALEAEQILVTLEQIHPSSSSSEAHYCKFCKKHVKHSLADCFHNPKGEKYRGPGPDGPSQPGNKGAEIPPPSAPPANQSASSSPASHLPKGQDSAPKKPQSNKKKEADSAPSTKPQCTTPNCPRPHTHPTEKCFLTHPEMKKEYEAKKKAAAAAGNSNSNSSSSSSSGGGQGSSNPPANRGILCPMPWLDCLDFHPPVVDPLDSRDSREDEKIGFTIENNKIDFSSKPRIFASFLSIEDVACDIDSGCTSTVMNVDFAKSHNISYEPIHSPAVLLANNSTVPRIGLTLPIDVSFRFVNISDNREFLQRVSIKNVRFELFDTKGKGNPITFGADLMQTISETYGNDAFMMANFGIFWSNGSAPPVANKSIQQDPRDPLVDDDLAADKPYLFNDEENIQQWTIDTQQILNRPDVKAAIEINRALDVKVPIQHPEALISFKLQDGFDLHSLKQTQYPMSPAHQAICNRTFEELLSKGFIKESFGPSPVNIPVFAVQKMEGGIPKPGAGRVVMDYRAVNRGLATVDRFPLLGIDHTLLNISSKKYFGEVDIAECFHQFALTPESQFLTTFTWNNKQYVWTRAPFGPSPLPQIVHRVNSKIFDFPWCFGFIDNLDFASDSIQEHGDQLLSLLHTANKFHIRFKCDAIKVAYVKIRILGYILSKQGRQIDPRKVDEFLSWAAPSNPKEMASFLGLLSWVRPSIRHLGEITFPPIFNFFPPMS